jgi:hypothetical protein
MPGTGLFAVLILSGVMVFEFMDELDFDISEVWCEMTGLTTVTGEQAVDCGAVSCKIEVT